MPEPFTRARMLARTGAYAFVEVYASGDLRPVTRRRVSRRLVTGI